MPVISLTIGLEYTISKILTNIYNQTHKYVNNEKIFTWCIIRTSFLHIILC